MTRHATVTTAAHTYNARSITGPHTHIQHEPTPVNRHRRLVTVVFAVQVYADDQRAAQDLEGQVHLAYGAGRQLVIEFPEE